MKYYFETFEEFFLENMPTLYSHFKKQKLTPDMYLIDWYVYYAYFDTLYLITSKPK